MARLFFFLCVILLATTLFSASANVVVYYVTLVSCVQNSTCPQGNLPFFNQTFALNGTLSPNLTLNVGDQLEFLLAVNVTIHPLAICQNSTLPSFCQGAANGSLLNTPITQAGSNTSFTFTTAGTYYYGCLRHPGMGATINVVQTNTTTTTASTTTSAAQNTTTTASTTTSTAQNTTTTASTTTSAAQNTTTTASTTTSTAQNTTTTASTTTSRSGVENKLAAPFLIIAIFTLLSIITI